jgi:citrate lyase subunit beta / citryl-CoA lyase
MVMSQSVTAMVAPLFVPATRLDRVAGAARSGADAIIVDLEDAVGPAEKVAARDAVANFDLPELPTILRVNDATTIWHEGDVVMARGKGFAAIMVPKSESIGALTTLHHTLGGSVLLALVETARGIAAAQEIAAADGVRRLAFGSVDFCADMGCAHEPDALLFARTQLVLASRLAGLTAPIDGVTLAVEDEQATEADARRAVGLGFGGKLCIHPRQIAPVLRGFCPTQAEIAWASTVMAAAGDGAVKVGQTMIDAPVRRRAEQIHARAALTQRMVL